MIAFSTDAVAPHERFDHWREVRGKKLFGVTIELEPERRADFSGSFRASTLAGATLATISASAYRVSRTAADIAAMPGDSLVVSQQIAGPGWCDTGTDQPFFVTGGTLVAGHSDRAFAGIPSTQAPFRFRTVKIPLQSGPSFPRPAQLLDLPSFDLGASGYSHLIAASLTALFDDTAPLAETEAEQSIGALGQMVLLARALAARGAPPSRLALRTAHRHALRQIMRRHFHRMDLSAEIAGAMLGISKRQVHAIFEPTGGSFMTTLQAIRIEEACRQLVAQPATRVTEIGFACGFGSLATFYRAFQGTVGIAPNDYRRMAWDQAIH
ncbi:helix-turn-helix domain-containing protein [Phreatobacter stygius]|uniref:AraC family transcriptional regulator n=1 Tax=Phreatobacter stygius TaxID=1940610 RepID=A0A4D7B5E6_9HYPH|nr:helix-turn-helix domain-containing protein [Phreatobacter stygius]QCI63227.1 AraC family transcriptional regulator [Phreatobacter stygius]